MLIIPFKTKTDDWALFGRIGPQHAYMAITLSELTEKIDDKWHQFLVTEGTELLEISVDTTTYVHTSGSKSLPIIFKLEEEGSYLKVIAHSLYVLKPRDLANKYASFYRALLRICWETKLVQFECDSVTGEIRAIIETAIEDSTLTKKQVNRMIDTLVAVIEHYHNELTDLVSGEDIKQPSPLDLNLVTRYNKFFNSRKDQSVVR
jgi:hypothetical protein